jgi:hypothetical protein
MTTVLPKSLTRVVADAATANPDLDSPYALASLIAIAVPDDDIRALFAEALMPFVRAEQGRIRSAAMRELRGAAKVLHTSSPEADGGKFLSAKVAGYHAAWEKFLLTKLQVRGRTVDIGACTAEDLDIADKSRRATAYALLRAADFYGTLAELLRNKGVATVADLDPRDVPPELLAE